MSAMMRALLSIYVLVLLSTGTSTLPSGQPMRNQAPELPERKLMICDANTSSCVSGGNLTHSTGGCHPPLTQGPCPDGQWLVLDLNASTSGALGKCVTLRCPPDSLTRECRRSMQAFARACPPLPTGDAQSSVHMDPSGQWRCGVSPGREESLSEYVNCLLLEITHSFATRTSGPLCAQGDTGECSTHVTGSQSNITLNPED